MGGSRLDGSVEFLKRCLARVRRALTVNEAFFELELSPPGTRTTAADGDVGWRNRPPAVVACPECDAEIHQHRPTSAIDCPECWAGFEGEAFSDLELLYLSCPRCSTRMQHGRRHPDAFDIPQWATCDDCGYHWEFAHSY